jgi:feruloyl esterase
MGSLAPMVGWSQTACDKLTSLHLAQAKVLSAELVPEGPTKISSPLGAPIEMKLPEYCKVKGEANPTSDSKIAFELWLPSKTWNGEYLQLGNGGLAGSIGYAAMYPQLQRNFAVAATDDGHTGIGTDGSWAAGHPEKVIDFGYRAVHETSENAQQILSAFYGHKPKYSYFNGCSEGGREAMIEAQRYPDDFNGILAGSPALAWMDLMTAFAWNSQSLVKDPESYIPESKRPAIEKAALAACGTQDGLTDPFIKNPLSCHFDPSPLLCKTADGDDCLTAKQLTALEKIYGGAHNSAGQKIADGYAPGAEGEPGYPGLSYTSYIYGPKPGMSLDIFFSSSFYGSFVFDNPKYSVLSLDFDRDVPFANKKVGPILNATDPDLKAFKAHGGKLLHYHGWYDGSPSPFNSVGYYRSVSAKMGGDKATQSFYRLFMVPGMMHCGTGPGPNAFGDMLDSSHYGDPARDIFSALQDWVEHGKAPEAIIATKYTADDATKPVVMTRPICPFPAQAKWNGKGSSNDSENFSCRVPGHE